MKKTMLLAVCLVLVGLLSVNGTLATSLTQVVDETLNEIFRLVEGLANPTPTAKPEQFDVSIIYIDANGAQLSSSAPPQLMPGHTVDRYTAVLNHSASYPAYFRMAMAVQADVADLLTFDLNTTNYEWTDWMDINGGALKMNIATYIGKLSANTQSPPVLRSVTLSDATTNADMLRFRDDFLQMQVFAINADDFPSYPSPEAALDAALNLSSTNHPFQ